MWRIESGWVSLLVICNRDPRQKTRAVLTGTSICHIYQNSDLVCYWCWPQLHVFLSLWILVSNSWIKTDSGFQLPKLICIVAIILSHHNRTLVVVSYMCCHSCTRTVWWRCGSLFALNGSSDFELGCILVCTKNWSPFSFWYEFFLNQYALGISQTSSEMCAAEKCFSGGQIHCRASTTQHVHRKVLSWEWIGISLALKGQKLTKQLFSIQSKICTLHMHSSIYR